MREFATLDEMRALVGQEVALSPWVEITQQCIAMFADATDDHQWIHVDPERCVRESPFKTPVAHGFLTLSLLSSLFEQSLRMTDAKMVVNYGLNKVRFPAPVPVGSRVRARLTLLKIDQLQEGAQLEWSVLMEREGDAKPVCVAELIMRRYP
ncbi:MaoC family dehydratase [Massilia sp. TSP1-1-2]|uniref:MaoC family dehydratase n=1 Tax=unclassified Massilia TaxID=2609279 RepID=UPI003CE9768B